MEVLGGSNQWNVSFSREAHDWELEVFASFFQVLHSNRVRQGCEDRLWWISSKRGIFKVKSLFYSLAWLVLKVGASLGRVCGGRRLLRERSFCMVGDFGQNADPR
jgi:hypothetical protein